MLDAILTAFRSISSPSPVDPIHRGRPYPGCRGSSRSASPPGGRRSLWLGMALLSAMLVSAVASAADPLADEAAPMEAERAAIALNVDPAPFKGDIEDLVERRVIRALVPFSKTFYYVEKGRQRGVSYEVFSAFEKDLNAKLKTRRLKVHVLFVPAARDELIPKLVDGYGDLIFADLTVTERRQERVDFSDPMFTGIDEIVVTGPGGPLIRTAEDLSGQEVFVRKTSSYHEHLEALNRRLSAAGQAPVSIRAAPEALEAEDILEMLDAGLIGATVVDRYKALMWGRIFTAIRPCPEATVSQGGEYAFVMRKGSPGLMAEVNAFVKRHAKGTIFGNTIVNRYVKNPEFVKNAAGEGERRRFGRVVELFRKYGDRYALDPLLMIAQGFQESGLDHDARSPVGAIGIMQIMPATGKELEVGDIRVLENNVHGGVKYIRFLIDQYFKDEPMTPLDKGLFAFAAYNAGPRRLAGLRKEAAKRGLDPNRWFGHVELAAAEKIGGETVTYVANIYKYYIAYKLIETQDAERREARQEVQKRGPP
ncbi:MAG: lytic transglycosylase F [Deltaproteobacteria bacterium]|nr:lytic transglycosylase F [Deltaproteobacteria bacterium]